MKSYVLWGIAWLLVGLISGMIENVFGRERRWDFTLANLFENTFWMMIAGFLTPAIIIFVFIDDKFHDIVIIKGRKNV